MIRRLALLFGCALAMPLAVWAEQPSVRVEPPQLQGSRSLEKQTGPAVVRDYLQSWQSFQAAMEQNRADLLAPDFVGTAHDKLAATIQQQAALGIHTQYRAQSHDLQIIFYSPEGRSIELTDSVEYEESVYDRGKSLATERVHARYLVVLTPAQTRWQVRIFQAAPPAATAFPQQPARSPAGASKTSRAKHSRR